MNIERYEELMAMLPEERQPIGAALGISEWNQSNIMCILVAKSGLYDFTKKEIRRRK